MKGSGWLLVHAMFLASAVVAEENPDAFQKRVQKLQAQYEENVRTAARYPFREFEKAAESGDVATVKRLLDQGVPADLPLPWPEESFEGIPPSERAIHLAAGGGHIEIVRLLLGRGADPNGRAGEGNFTPLHAAVDVEIAKLLISRGADVNSRDSRGAQPIHSAAFIADQDVHLRVDAVKSQALIRFLIKQGADPVAEDHEGCQPIHLAARGNTAESVALFLDHGAKPDAAIHNKGGASDSGWKPLHFAANRQGNKEEALEIAELLIRKGADVNAVTAGGETPLHLSKNAAMTRFLLDRGAKANVMSTNISRMLPIHRYALSGDAESIRLLLDRGTDPDVLTGGPDPETPLDIAVFFNRRNDAARLLLKRGAKPTERTLAAAERSENQSMIGLIRARLDSSPKRPPHRQ